MQVETDEALQSGVSALNFKMAPGLFSDGEPTSALLAQQDEELRKLKMCSPSQNNFQTISDPEEREERNRQIDAMYELRNSQQNKQYGQNLQVPPAQMQPAAQASPSSRN